MKTKIEAHLLFLQGHHIEILLEIPKSIVVHVGTEDKNSKESRYHWDGQKLSLNDAGGFNYEILISDTNLFERKSKQALSSSGNQKYFFLTKDEANSHPDYETLPGYKSLFYCLNRWRDPSESWEFDNAIHYFDKNMKNKKANRFASLKDKSEEIYSFTIEANPDEIVIDWIEYHKRTKDSAFIFGTNCAVASQWFLEKYANIPHPKCWSAPFGLNQLMYYIHTPSFMPAFALIPWRVFENARFHLESRKKPNIKDTYLQINFRIILNSLLTIGGISGIILASKHLSRFVNLMAIPSLGFFSMNRSSLIFDDLNKRALKKIVENNDFQVEDKPNFTT